jgi:hypothetical protein
MKRMEMEMAMRDYAEKISESKLIQKCAQIAEKFGKGGSTSKEWANERYVFEKEALKIDYEVYAMGDKQLRVHFSGEKVFEVDENTGEPIKNPNPMIVQADRSYFEILCYKPGDWESMVESIIRKMNEEVRREEAEDVRKRFGNTLSK